MGVARPFFFIPDTMKCLENYIGIRGCGQAEPESGLYVDQLAGISLKLIDNLANSEQLTFQGVWSDVQTRALRQFTTLVIAHFKTKYRLKRLVDEFVVGDDASYDLLDPANEYRGVTINLKPNQAYPTATPAISPLIKMCMAEIEFFATDDVADVEFLIATENNINDVLWSEVIDLKFGWNKIKAHFCMPAFMVTQQMIIAADCNGMATINTFIGNGTSSQNGGCCECCIDNCCSAVIKGGIYNLDDQELTYYTDNSFGFRLVASLQCSYEGLVCANKEIFATALWYLLGKELMFERMHSDRLNKWTTIDRSRAKELHDMYQETFQREMDIVIDGIDLFDNGCCLECDPVVSYQETQL